MATYKPWLTSEDLINNIKRNVAVPLSQVTFSTDDLLAFCNNEMSSSLISEVMSYNEEFFVYKQTIPLVANQLEYPIPDRAIGMKVRGVFYQDSEGNIFEMTRINPDDQAFFQATSTNNQNVYKFFFEGNQICLTPSKLFNPVGSLVVSFYLRPNQLVANERAAIIESFSRTISITNASVVANDVVTIGTTNFTAISGGSPVGNEFLIGASGILTATNLVAAIAAAGVVSSVSNITQNISTNVVNVTFPRLDTVVSSSNGTAFNIPEILSINFDQVPSDVFSVTETIDFLQTKPGHRIYTYDVPVVSISGTSILFADSNVPSKIIVGDYVCLSNECIIPQLPPELHNILAEKACSRLLAAQGDTEGVGAVNQKLAEMYQKQGNMLDNRSTGNPQKILNRHSLLRYGKITRRNVL